MEEEGEIEELFLNEKPVRVVLNLRRKTTDNYVSALSRQIDATYSHTIKVLKRMEDMGLVQTRKDGRKKKVELTERGEKLAQKFSELLEEIEDRDPGS